MAPQTQTRRILIKVDTQGSGAFKSIKREIASLNEQLTKGTSILGKFNNIFNAFLGASVLGIGIGQITQLADSYSLLFDRVKVFTGSAENAQAAFEGIERVARQNNSSIEAIATTYNRLNLALSDAGVTSEQTLRITDLLQKSFRLSGSTISEATAATIQLSQGLASGQLRGQELRSVLEQNAIIGDLLSKSLGGTRGELMKLAEDGKITSDIFVKALAKGATDLDEKSQKLGITFEQVGLKLKDKLLVFIGQLSKDFDAAGKLSKGLDVLIEKIPALTAALAALSAAILYLQRTALTGLLAKIAAFGTGVGAILAGIGVATFLVVDNFQALVDFIPAAFNSLVRNIKKSAIDFASGFLSIVRVITGGGNEISKSLEETIASLNSESASLNGSFGKNLEEPIARLRDFKNAGIDLNKINFKKPKEEAAKFKDELAALNKLYNSGGITLEQYNGRLSNLELKELNKQLKEGKINLQEFNTKAEDLARMDIQRMFEMGAISLSQYNDIINANRMQDLNEKFVKGKINVEEYNRALIETSQTLSPGGALYVGTADFLQRIGTVSQNVAGLVADTFGKLEDSLLQFIETGKFSFKEFSKSIIQEINRIILRALIIRPLAQGILGAIGPSAAAPLPAGAQTLDASVGFGNYAAKGFAPGGSGVTMFAKGGIVDGATPFTFGGTKKGIMGEAGPEAIMPLRRGADGSLGVQSTPANVIVNIVNQAGTEVEQRETTQPDGTRIIDVLVTAKVKEGIARGDFDRAFQTSFGLSRKGT